jgi:hypothetical protein
MSNLGVDNIKGSDGISGPSIAGNVVFSGTSHIVLPKGTTAQRPTGVAAGSLRFNTDTKLVEQYTGVDWVTLNSYGVGRGVFGGGTLLNTGDKFSVIEYITISTLGNASGFGNLIEGYEEHSACSSSTRGVFGGGIPSSSPSNFASGSVNTISYITISTTGNATDFGDLTEAKSFPGSCSSSTRGVFGGGISQTSPYPPINTIEYITIATTGNAIDFGDLTQARSFPAACSSSTRGIFSGGYTPTPTLVNTIDYITIATTGNATDFGDLTIARSDLGACSSSTRGVFGAGYISPSTNTIDYITIATTGNAQDFGDLTVARDGLAACSSSTRGVFGAGYISPTSTNTIDYITIASQGTNAQTFGQLTQARFALAALSDAHGGLS